jgi:hypothetical protein
LRLDQGALALPMPLLGGQHFGQGLPPGVKE